MHGDSTPVAIPAPKVILPAPIVVIPTPIVGIPPIVNAPAPIVVAIPIPPSGVAIQPIDAIAPTVIAIPPIVAVAPIGIAVPPGVAIAPIDVTIPIPPIVAPNPRVRIVFWLLTDIICDGFMSLIEIFPIGFCDGFCDGFIPRVRLVFRLRTDSIWGWLRSFIVFVLGRVARMPTIVPAHQSTIRVWYHRRHVSATMMDAAVRLQFPSPTIYPSLDATQVDRARSTLDRGLHLE